MRWIRTGRRIGGNPGSRTVLGLLVLATALAATPPAASATTLKGARSKALKATKAERSPGTILFGLNVPLRPGTSIRESGRKPPPSGTRTRTRRMPVVATVGGEPTFFFYLDRGAYQDYEHAGRVVLVGARSGRVRRSRSLRFAPAINGRLPVFLRTREGYELRSYRVSSTPYEVTGAARAARAGLGTFGGEPATGLRSAASERAVAARLAAERSCTIVIGGRRSIVVGSLGSASGTPILPLLSYDPRGGRSLASFVATEAIGRRGCRDVLIAMTGDGYRSLSPPTIRTRLSTSGSRMRENHVSSTTLRSAIAANPSVTFKLMIDGPGSGGYVEALKSLANVLVIATSSTASQTAFRYLPEKSVAGAPTRNPLRMRTDSSFFTTLLFGGAAFAASDAEVAHAAGEVAAGRVPSFLAYMVARAFQLSRPFDFTADLGATQRLYTTFPVTPPGPSNRAPVATPSSVTTAEDTPAPVALNASDPDGDPLTYTVGAPAHGTLSGTAPNLTYTPAANYNGPDAFTFSASDGSLASATATVSIAVTAVEDPPVTTASGGLDYTENAAPTAIAPALTVADVDSPALTGAKVQITANHVAAADVLALPAQPAITAAFDAASGTLTLSGTASVAAYQAALRAVTYANSSDDPASAPRTVTFSSRDAGGFGPAATRTIAIVAVNDPPVLSSTATALTYEEDDPATAVDPGIDLADPDSQISGATVQITGNYASAEDVLALPAQPSIGASFDPPTGRLTLSGTAGVAAYEAALRAVTYRDTSSTPSTATRTVSFQVTDGASAASNVATRDIAIGAVDDAPVVTASAGTTAYTENAAAVTVDGGVTVADVDDASLESLTVRISAGFAPGDVLTFAPGSLSGSYAPATGILTLSGTDTVAAYQAVLRSVGFRSTSDHPAASKAISFTVDDGDLDSAPATKAIAVTRVNDAPVVTTTSAALAYPENAGPIAAAGGVTVTDPDSAQLTGATVQVSSSFVSAQDELAFADQLGISGSYDDTSGLLTLTGTSSVANYQAALRAVTYENSSDNPSPPARTLTFLASDASATSAPATRNVTLGAANDAATVTTTATALAYAEGNPATPIDAGLTVADPDDTSLEGATVRITGGRQSDDVLLFTNAFGVTSGGYVPATGTLTLTGTTSLANYQSALRSVRYRHDGDDPSAAKTVAFRADDGGGLGPASTRNIAVAPVNDAPTVTTSGGSATFTEGGGPVVVDGGVGIADPDSTQLSGATVSIGAGFQAALDTLSFTGAGAIGGSYAAGTGVLTLAGAGTVAQYETVLRSVTYASSSDDPAAAPSRTIAFQVTDSSASPSNVASRTVTLAGVNDAPVVTATGGSTAYTENAASVAVDGGVTVTDADDGTLASARARIASGFDAGDVLTFTPAGGAGAGPGSGYNAGTGVLTLNGPGTVADLQAVLRSVRFSSTSDDPATAKTIELKVNDGAVDSNLATKAIAVTPVNDAPIVATTGASLGYTENAPPTPVDPGLTITDPDSSLVSGATVTIQAPGLDAAQDALALPPNASFTSLYSSATGVLTVTAVGSVSVGALQAALRTVTYANSSDGPAPPSRTIAFQAFDDQSAGSNVATRAIAITAVNDPPTAVSDSDTTDEDTTLNVSVAPGVLGNDTDPDPGDTQTVTKLNGSATLTGTSAKGAAVTINANGTYSYDPGAVFQGLSTGQQDTDSFTYTMQDGAGAQSTATVTLTIAGVSDAPTAVADTFNAIGNTGLYAGTTAPAGEAAKQISGSVLANDTDPDTPAASLVAEPVTNAATTLGGTITIESDGNFTYQPGAGVTGMTDTITYRVCDASPCNSGTVANATGTLSLPIAGQVWYVKNNQAPGQDGTSDTPFDTLGAAEAASGSADTTFVFDGANTTTNLDTGYAMDPGERLVGEVTGLVVDPDGGGPLTPQALLAPTANVPRLTTTQAEDVVRLAAGATIEGFEIDPGSGGGGIAGGTGTVPAGPAAGNVTIANVHVDDTATSGTGIQPGLELDTTTGTNAISNLEVDNGGSATAIGVRLDDAGTVSFASSGTMSIATSGAKALDVTGPTTSMGAGSVFDDVTVTGSGSGGVSMLNTTGTTTFGALSLTTTAGATGAFVLNNAGAVTVPGAGTANVSSTGGPAIDVSSTPAALAFDTVSVVSSVASGIVLDSLGSGTFSATGGTIAGVASGVGSTAFKVVGGSGDVTYAGDIADGTGGTVLVQNRTGGTVTLSGTITDGPDVNGGPAVVGSSGGSTVFSGPAKTFSTGGGSGVSLVANTGHTISFTNGGLDVDTTSGVAFSASGGGTVDVTGAANTIDTGTGNGLLVDNTTIGASNVTFQRVSTNGAAVGIRASNTGASGRLVVTGNGGTCTNADTSGCSGGTIANGAGADDSGATPAGTGIVLNNTLNPSFTRMWLHDHANYAIRGHGVAGLTLARSVINGANGTNGTTPFDDSSVWLDNLTGSAAVSDTYVSGGFEDNFRVVNTSGSLNRIAFSNDTFGSSGARPSNDAVLLETNSGAAQLQATVTNSTFTSAGGDLLQFNHGGTGAGDLVLTSNAFSNNNPTIGTGGGGLSLFSSGIAGANTTMSVSGNSFRDAVGPGVLVVKTIGPATQTGTFTNNTIGVAAATNSGSAEGSALKLQMVDQGSINWSVTNNTIRGYNNFGIEVLAGGGGTPQSGTLNTTLTGNTITQPGNTPGTITIPKQGIHYNIGTVPGDTFQACADIKSNNIDTSGADGVPATGVNVDVRLRQRQATTIRLPGYAGANNDNAAVQSFVNANNSAGTSTLAANTVPTGGGFTGAGSTCP